MHRRAQHASSTRSSNRGCEPRHRRRRDRIPEQLIEIRDGVAPRRRTPPRYPVRSSCPPCAHCRPDRRRIRESQAIERRSVQTWRLLSRSSPIETRLPLMNRALRRAAPVALASAAALLLAGCAGSSEPEASETPAAAECMDVAVGLAERWRHGRGRVRRIAHRDLHHPARGRPSSSAPSSSRATATTRSPATTSTPS